METLLTCNSREAAEHLESRLRDAGFANTSLLDESNIQRYIYLSKPEGAFKVVVEEQDLEAAQNQLRTWEESGSDPDLKEVIYCPECHGSDLDYPQASRKPVVPTVALDILMVTGLVPRSFYCRSCHHEWEKQHPAEN